MNKKVLDLHRTDVFRMSIEMEIAISNLYDILELSPDPATKYHLDKVDGSKTNTEYVAALNDMFRYLESFGFSGRNAKVTEIQKPSWEDESGWSPERSADSDDPSEGGIPVNKFAEFMTSAEREGTGVPWGTEAQKVQMEREVWEAPNYAEAKEIYDVIPYGSPEHDAVTRIIAFRFFQKPPEV